MPRRRQSAASRAVPFEVVEDLDDGLASPEASVGAAAAGGSAPAGHVGDGARAAGSVGSAAGDGADGTQGRLGEAPSGAGDTSSGSRAIRWKPWAAVAGVLALVVGGLAIGGKIEERRTAARLVTSVGGVLPFTGPPQELWSFDLNNHLWMPFGGLLLSQVDEGGLTAVDVLTGKEVWQATVGPDAYCGRPSIWQTLAEETGPLLCLSGTADAQVVSVLDTEGQVTGSRNLGPVVEGASYAVGPGSTVVRVRRDGPVGPPVGPRELYDESGDATFVDVPGGRAVVVTLEDAVSGDVLWENEVPFVAPDEAWECQDLGDMAKFALDRVSSMTTGYVVTVDGCGISAAFDADGTRLDDETSQDDLVEPLTATTVSRFDQTTQHTTVLDRTGTSLWEVTGPLLRPSATDGTGEDTVLVDTLSGLAAFRPDGTELWDASTYASRLFVHTSAVLVVDDGANGLTALDPTTGRTVWTVPGEDSVYPFGAATDGSQAIVLAHDDDGSARSVGYDLATGEVLWTGASAPNVGLLGYHGALLQLQLSENRVSRVG
ncbi:outer membrane protein assembly factor BamB family protein [Oerskovia enterophila]|uniref:PQQ enzyme repeat protein n=1 Tax=Oerskovia enterophila TaxID=43678 RepID=A0ABX2Y0G6_9CELL|nr:PQQ-binding-like beta-propeller repeat protein [Oerskovia enterophila]OCI29827.1 PQQ enzyme repeat protein [Oerskovia enterophila]